MPFISKFLKWCLLIYTNYRVNQITPSSDFLSSSLGVEERSEMGWEKEVLVRIGPLHFGSPGLYHLNLAETAQSDHDTEKSCSLSAWMLPLTHSSLWSVTKVKKREFNFHLI